MSKPFIWQEPFLQNKDGTEYTLISDQHITVTELDGEEVIKIAPEALTLLARQAFYEASFFLRSAHLQQVASILNDPQARPVQDDYMKKLLAQETQAAQDARLEGMLRQDAARAGAQGDMDKYKLAIATKVRGNLLRPPGLSGNPEATFEVDQLPSGEVLNLRLKRSSGVAALDEAIERAIRRSSPLPLPPNPSLFQRTLEFKFRPLAED